MFPTDKGESVSRYVSRIVQIIDRSGLNYRLTPMGTIVEAETLDEVLDLIRESHDCLEADCARIYSSLKMDIRKGPTGRLEGKVRSVEEKIGKVRT